MPRPWNRTELETLPETAAESARLARYAARLLAATATATAMTALVATSTGSSLLEPIDRARAEDAKLAAGADPSVRPGGAEAPVDPTGRTTASPPVAGSPADVPRVSGEPTDPLDEAPGRTASDGEVPAVEEQEQAPPATGEVPPQRDSQPRPTATQSPDEPLAVTLTDDDQGLPLFAAGPLAPGSRTVRCITLTYAGSKDSADVSMRVLASGELASWLTVQVTAGTAAPRSCDGFVARGPSHSGSLSQLTAAGPVRIQTATPDVPFGVQIVTELRRDAPDEAAGATALADLVWSTG